MGYTVRFKGIDVCCAFVGEGGLPFLLTKSEPVRPGDKLGLAAVLDEDQSSHTKDIGQ